MADRRHSGSRLPAWGRRLLCAAGLVLAGSAQAADEQRLDEALALQARYLAAEAVSYEHGEGVARDQAHAARLYCEAARLGDAEAMYALGWMYANARGLERHDGYAHTLFAMAAVLGHEQAGRLLAHTGEYRGEAPACLHLPDSNRLRSSPLQALVQRLPSERRQLATRLRELAPEYGIDPEFAQAVAMAESAFNPQAVSPRQAIGVMQLIPETAARFRVANPFDAEQNMRGGLAYLRWLLAYFEGDVRLVAAGYNAGEGAVDRHQGVPPYAETRDYVQRILRYLGRERHAHDPAVAVASPRLRALRVATAGDESAP